MNSFTITFKGTATRSLIGETSRASVLITAWDKGEANERAKKMAEAGMVLAGVSCDKVQVIRVARGKRA